MTQPEIAAVFCAAICDGYVPALLQKFVDSQAKWTLVSGAVQGTRLAPTDSSGDFYGIAGLQALSHFCRERLQVLSGEMTGWVIRQNCGFAFGRLDLRWSPEKQPVETTFVAKLLWGGLQILLGEIRIMWPFPFNDVIENSNEATTSEVKQEKCCISIRND